MRIEDQRESDNVEDMRTTGGGMSGGGFPISLRPLGIGAIVVALAASYLLGVDPVSMLALLSGNGAIQPAQVAHRPASTPVARDEKAIFVSKVLASTEDTWDAIFRDAGKQYAPPKLDLFTGSFPTACGMGQAAAGPFYCPADRKVYIDLGFYQLMRDRFHASGDFAQAYVIAHEVGHHVQNLLGISGKMQAMRQRVSAQEYNGLSVRLELQADCLAGVWANRTDRTKHFLEPGDVESALNAASAIGDDTLQRQSRGYVVPDSFTHGSSAQRMSWLKQGLESGDPNACDTFRATQL
jgi:uncharacterized protein